MKKMIKRCIAAASSLMMASMCSLHVFAEEGNVDTTEITTGISWRCPDVWGIRKTLGQNSDSIRRDWFPCRNLCPCNCVYPPIIFSVMNR